jgi:hypothetical protein
MTKRAGQTSHDSRCNHVAPAQAAQLFSVKRATRIERIVRATSEKKKQQQHTSPCFAPWQNRMQVLPDEFSH